MCNYKYIINKLYKELKVFKYTKIFKKFYFFLKEKNLNAIFSIKDTFSTIKKLTL